MVLRAAAAAGLARGAGLQWLSPDEHGRLQAMASIARQAQFFAGRFVARSLLAALHGGDPLQDWPLGADASAPPRLLAGARLDPEAACLSISHSGDLVACAADAFPIGVDVESPRRRDLDTLAAAVCTPAEQAELAALAADARQVRFYEAWTLKEAFLKQRGEGVFLQRMAALDTVRAGETETAEAAHAWSWRHDACVLSVAARVAPARFFGDACALGSAQAWTLRDALTSP